MQAQAVGLVDGMVDGFERFGTEKGRTCRNLLLGSGRMTPMSQISTPDIPFAFISSSS